MKLEYRYLSEKKAAEIDALGITNPTGRKVPINYRECVTNEDETIVYQIIYHATNYNIDRDYDQYLLFYKGHRYILEVDDCCQKEIKNEETFHYFKSIIYSVIPEYSDCSTEEVLSVLKDVLYEWARHRGRNLVFGMDIPMEIIYLGGEDLWLN